MKSLPNLPLKVVLSIEAISPALTGIGRYTCELASRMPQHLGADQMQFHRQGHWVQDPSSLLRNPIQPTVKPSALGAARTKLKWPQWPRWIKRGYTHMRLHKLEKQCHRRVFHGPNYFLPPCADVGVATVHDLSIFKYPETHPLERIKQFEREFAQSMARAAHLITDSEATRLEVIDYLGWAPEKITAVPLGVSTAFMQPATLHAHPSKSTVLHFTF